MIPVLHDQPAVYSVYDVALKRKCTTKKILTIEAVFRTYKRTVAQSWHMDETYIEVNGAWKFLYRAVDKEGITID